MSVSSSTSGKLFELRTREHTPRFIDHHQYVGMINDVLKLRKNLCVCRHFHKLDKMAVTRYHERLPHFTLVKVKVGSVSYHVTCTNTLCRTRQFKHIDVWPINLFTPDDDDPFDTSSLFMLQLACILNMVCLLTCLRGKKIGVALILFCSHLHIRKSQLLLFTFCLGSWLEAP